MSVLDAVREGERERLRAARHPDWVAPMLATLHDEVFSADGWLYERKLDGERCLGFRDGDRVRLLSRNRKPAEAAYPELVDALGAHLPADAVVDGEVVAFEGGRTSFARLQPRMHVTDPEEARRSGVAVFYYVFDLPYVDGHDCTGLPLRTRKGAAAPGGVVRRPAAVLRPPQPRRGGVPRRGVRQGLGRPDRQAGGRARRRRALGAARVGRSDQMAFTEWTADGRLRHPRFQGLRRDKDPADVVKEHQ